MERRMNEHCPSSMIGKQENHNLQLLALSQAPSALAALLDFMRYNHSYMLGTLAQLTEAKAKDTQRRADLTLRLCIT